MALNAGDRQSLPVQLRTHRDSARQTKHGKYKGSASTFGRQQQKTFDPYLHPQKAI